MLVVVSLLHVDVIVRVVDCIVAGSLEYCLGQDPIAFGIPASRNVPSPAGFRVCKYMHTDVHIRVLCQNPCGTGVHTHTQNFETYIYIYIYICIIYLCAFVYIHIFTGITHVYDCVCVRA